MKLVYPEIQSVFHFGNGFFPSAVIENQSLFYRFVKDLNDQCQGESGNAVLSRNDNPIAICGNLELLTNFFPFEINRKKLISKIITKLEQQAVAPEFYEKSQYLLGNIERFIFDLAFQNDFDLEVSKLSVSVLLKSAGICLKENNLSLSENILTYMELMRNNSLASVFVLVNLRSLLDDDTTERFISTCCAYEYNIMLIDNHEYRKLSKEKRIVIDADFCEF